MTLKYDKAVPVKTEFEFRVRPDGGTDFEGWAVVYDADSEPMPFVESFAPNSFSRSLSAKRIHTLVVNHDDSQLLASTRTGRLGLTNETRGVLSKASLPDTSYASDLRNLDAVGEVWGMSFQFKPTRKGDSWSDDGQRRRVTEANLGHVTILTGLQPAYAATTGLTQFRALAEALQAEVEDLDDLFDAIREGRDLSDSEKSLMARLADQYRDAPEALELPAPTYSLADWKAREDAKRQLLGL